MKRNKVVSMFMLLVMLSQIFAPFAYNTSLIASEISSEQISEAQSGVTSEVADKQSEVTSEVTESQSEVEANTDQSASDSEIDSEQPSTDSEVSPSLVDVSDVIKLIEMNPTDLSGDESSTNRIEFAINPTDNTSGVLLPGENWSSISITLDPELVFNQEFGLEISQAEPKVITDYTVTTNPDGTTTIDFEIDSDAINSGGQTIGIIFVTSVEGGVDLGQYGIKFEMNGDQGSHYESNAEITYHDPAVMEITKEMTAPTYAAAGEEITYSITMTANGTGEITADPLPQIIDQLPSNVEYVSSTPAGVYDETSNTVTWDWSAEDITNRSKTVEITIIPDEEFYENGDTLTNTADAMYEGSDVDSAENVQDIYPGFFIEFPDGPIDKNGSPSTNPNGTTTAPGDSIFWHFDNINYQGNGTLENYTITDKFPQYDPQTDEDILLLNKVCYGAVKESPNAFVNATITYKDGHTEVITAADDKNGDNCVEIPSELDIPREGVVDIVWNYGTVNLPFKIVGAGVDTTVSDTVEPDTKIDNNLESDFDIPQGDDGEWDICPPPLISYDNGDGTTSCRADDGSEITLTDDEVYGIFQKDILSTTSDINDLTYGDEITYRLTLGNAAASPGNLEVDGIYDTLPPGLEYIDGSTVISSDLPDSTLENYDTASNILSYTFLEDDTPLSIEPGKTYYIDFTAKVTSKEIETLNNEAYLVGTNPDLMLNGSGTSNITEPIDFDGDGVLENVYYEWADVIVNRATVNVEKEITNTSKVFVPANVEGQEGKSTVNYSFTFTNEDTKLFGQNYAPIIDPTLVDNLPKQAVLDQSSIVIDYTNAPDLVSGGETITVTGDSTSSPIDGEGQKMTLDLQGTLNPGDYVTVTYSAEIKDYAIAAQVENTVSFPVTDDEKDYYTENSVFEDSALGVIDEIASQKITKTTDKTEAQVGEDIQYVVEVTNTGTMPLKNVTFSDDIPHEGINGTTVNSILSKLPHVYYIRQGEAPVEQDVDFTVTYMTNGGAELTVTLNQGELEEFIVENQVHNITKLQATLPGVLYPGDMAQLVFDVETPISGDGAAVPGDELHNQAKFSSTAVKMDGSDGQQLENSSNQVTTTIVEPVAGTYSIGNFVYFDLDDNGYCDNAETLDTTCSFSIDQPAVGAVMDLKDESGNIIASTTVDENGFYLFSGLAPGNYTVSKQSGYFDKWYKVYDQNTGELSLDQQVTITDSDELDTDFRIVPASIIGTVYHDDYDADTTDDSYYNSIYDYEDGEAPLVTDDSAVQESQITLTGDNLTEPVTTTTENGMYAFYDLKAGDYTVETTPIITADDGQEYLLTNDSETIDITLEPGEVKTGVDFGYIEPVEVAGTIWYDINTDGVFDSGENTSAEFTKNRNLQVELLDSANNVLASTTSDTTDGTYSFTELLPANYNVKVTYTTETPNPIHGLDGTFGTDDSVFTEATDGMSSSLTNIVRASTPNTVYGNNDLGIYQNAYIAGNVYQDLNYDGVLDDTDKAATNITVDLMDSGATTVIATQVIDANGDYTFTEVDPGQDYTLRMSTGNTDDMFIDLNTPVSGQTDTAITVYSDTSQAFYTNGTDDQIKLVPDSQLIEVDGSVYQYAEVSSIAFTDMDGDGQQDYTNLDTYFPGINISLTGTDGMGAAVDRNLQSAAGSAVTFTDVNPGKSYKVLFDVPSGYQVTWKDHGDNATDSDIQRDTYDSYLDLYSNDSKEIDGGMYQPVNLSGYVFTDTDRDGYLSAGEDTPANGYNVTIKYNDDLAPTETTVTTDSNGYFELNGVEPGNYSTVVSVPDSSYQFTVKGTNGDSLIASDAETDGTTANQLLVSGDANNEDFDTGYNQKTSISGKIYLDTNTDLTRQDTELLIDGITVTLSDSTGVVATTTTDADGYYEFTDLEPNDYTVEASTVNYASYENEDETPSIQSNGKTPEFTAYSNTPVENVDGALSIAGDTTHYLISDYVWEDANYNDIQDSSETGIEGATVTLLDASGNPVIYNDSYSGLGINAGDTATTTTDSNGNYLLIVEGAGDYQVEISGPNTHYFADVDAGTDDTIDNDFTPTTTDTYIGNTEITVDRDTRDLDGGLSDKGTISGYVYNDEDKTHSYTSGVDPVVANSQVGLFAADGETFIELAKTDSNGYYQFTDLEAGDYVVKFENLQPKNAYWLQESDGTLYLDNGGYDAHRNVTLSYGQDLGNQNAGQNDQSVLSGIVYEDAMANGIYENTDDSLLEGVTVSLRNADDGSQATDDTGTELITTTNGQGRYEFINVLPGDYYVEFTAPSGYIATNVVPAGAEANADNDATINGEKIQTSTITVEENNGYLTLSDAALYLPVSISGYYYDDFDIDGQYDSGLDQPINGSTVTLVNDVTSEKITTTTDSNGYYKFTDVVPNDYHVEFDNSSYDQVSKLGTTATAYDNDIDSTGKTSTITYPSNTNDTVNNDAAVYNNVDLSGYIYEDMNNDGYYDIDSEQGLVTEVSLYNDEGYLTKVTTNADGGYAFTDLTPDQYYVSVQDPGTEYYNAKVGTNADGVIASELDSSLTFATQTLYSGQDDAVNFDGGFYQLTDIEGQVFFDSDTNFQLNGSEFGIPNLTISLYNEEDLTTPLLTTSTDSEGNYGFNDIVPGNYVVKSSSTAFGSYEDMPEAFQIKSDMTTPVFTAYSNTLRDQVDGAVTQGTNVYLIGDYVWEDTNADGLQDSTEAAYSGMKVELLDTTGTVVDTYTTDTDGLYYFFAPAGDYTLSFTAEDGYHFTKQALLNNDIDSNLPQTTDNVSVTDITVNANDLTYDAGVRKDGNINGRVYYDTDASGTWDATTDKADEERTVTLKDGSTIVDSQTISLTQDGSQGTYNFTDLEPGNYTIEFSDTTNKFWVQNSDGLLTFDNNAEGPATRTNVELDYGQTLDNQDAGYSTGASLAGFIYEDNDYDGTFSKFLATPTTSDIAIDGATVNLLDDSNNVLATTTTDSNGFYSFGNLEPYQNYATSVENKDADSDGKNDYTISVLGSESTKYDNDMTSGLMIKTTDHTLGDNAYNDYDYDGALLEYTNLSGYVYEDMEVNSTMDATDKGLSRVTANLYDQTGKFIDTTTTNSTGYYQFENIKPGYYYVQFELDGYQVSPLGTSGTALANDIDDTYTTSVIDVQSRNDDDVNFDAAVYKPVSVGGTVFTDGNADGLFVDSNEDGLSGISVELYNDQELVDTTTTNADGTFEFTNLLPDEYYTVVDSTDYLISPLATTGDVTNDLKSDSTTSIQYVPSSTTNYNDYDAGLYKLTGISGKIYLDTNADLTRQANEWLIPKIAVTLKDGAGNVVSTTTTDSNGYYEFTDLTPGDYEVVAATTDIADSYENEDEVPSIQSTSSTGVFTAISDTPNINVDGALTIAGDSNHFIISDYVWEDINYDGIQDASEPAMAGVTVRLLDQAGNQLTYTQDYPGLGITAGDKIEDTTDSNGNYLLIAETEDDFIVEVEATEDYYLTSVDSSSDDQDNDFTGVAGSTNIGQYPYHPTADTVDIDAGYSEVGTIAGTVYDDDNLNFMYDAGADKVVADSTVELYLESDLSTPIMTTTSDSNGYYQFKDLQAGEYRVKFESLRGLNGFWVPEADGSVVLDDEGYEAHRVVTIGYGEDKLEENAGKSDSLIFTGITYEDMIADGIYDPKEDKLIPNVAVEMQLPNGTTAIDGIGEPLTRTTNALGEYTLSHIIPTDYKIDFTTPNGYVETNVVPTDANATKGNDAKLTTDGYQTDVFSIEEGHRYSTYADASYYKPVTIEGDYYEDKDTDGSYDSGLDQLLSGYKVELIAEDGSVAAETTTDANGHYKFTDVVPGYYQVKFDTSDFDGVSRRGATNTALANDLNANGLTDQGRYLSGNTYSIENDGAVVNYATISGYIYEDGNNDGYMGTGETGLRTKVTLYDQDGNSQTVYSNHNGYYEFTDLYPGKYYVTVEAPNNSYHPANNGDNSLGLASEINKSYSTPKVAVYSSESNTTDFDGGMYRLGAISGQIFWDSNANLQLDGSEFGIPNTPVYLYRAEDLALKTSPMTPVTPYAMTTTDANGDYTFTDLVPGEYAVQTTGTYFGEFEDMPNDYQITSSRHTKLFTVVSGDVRTNVDGAVTRGAGTIYIGDYVWEDVDGDGLQDPTESGYDNATVNLLDEAGNIVDTTTTDPSGYYDFFAPEGNYQVQVEVADDYHFTANNSRDELSNSDTLETTDNVATTAIFDGTINRRDIDSGVRLDSNISGRVYYDTDASGTYSNGDSSTEPRTVSLYRVGGILRSDQLIETQEIDVANGGTYNFTDLTEGSYRLEFSDESNRFWVENSDGNLQFDNSSEAVATRDVTVKYGQSVTDQDAGYAYGAAISGYIFNDNNYNGRYDLDSESPQANAVVRLLTTDGTEVASTTTDSEGHYGFTNLEPGLSYNVVLDNQDTNKDGIADFTVSKTQKLATKLGNDMFNSDNVIKTEAVLLADNEVNDIDFDGGIVYTANIAGYVYQDKNIDSTYNEQDQMLNDIEVSLLDDQGQVVTTTMTDNGYYQFKNVEAGYYQVQFGIEDYNVSPKGQVDTKYDNDANNKYVTSKVNVEPNTINDISFDAAVYTDEDNARLMELGNTGQRLMMMVSGLFIVLIGLLYARYRLIKAN